MCFHTKQSQDATKLENRFKAKVKEADKGSLTGIYNGFDHPKTPIITAQEPDLIQCVEWGLVPAWDNDKSKQNGKLNARIETIRELPSFKTILHRKCLILLDGFYEWQHLDKDGKPDPNGKYTQKYLITLENEEPFAFAGLWTEWIAPNGELLKTYTIITTKAQGLMVEIHNKKLRMPVILTQGNESPWLYDQTRADLDLRLKAIKV
jgi:putative SOS response-associated peptidase YedK